MKVMHHFLIALGLGVCLANITLGESPPTSRPATPSNGWINSFFQYDATPDIAVLETTPTFDQVDFRHRPRQMPAHPPEIVASDHAAKPFSIGDINIVHLSFKDADGDVVPALLCTPRHVKGPYPVVIAVHGLTSNKAQICAQVGPPLIKRGFAVLAPDMPCHGERDGNPFNLIHQTDILKTFQMHRRAVIDVRECIDVAESRQDLDTRNGVTLAGYSMGSWIGSVVGPVDDRVKDMVLMVGGAVDIPAAAMLIPQVAATDPRLALANFGGRPLLMLNAKADEIVTPDMGRRLFSAAAEPKKQLWYEGGHLLPLKAYDDAAKWIDDTWKQITVAKDKSKPDA